MKKTKVNQVAQARRKFLKGASFGLVGGLVGTSCSTEQKQNPHGSNINFNKTYRWKILTTWPPNFPLLGEGCKVFADWVNTMSGGRMEIRVFGGGEIVPALETLEAVQEGVAEIGSSAAYYWAGKMPASQLFAAVPFGLNAQQMNTWLLAGGGSELWRELYEPFNLIPFPGGNTGVQMGGWYNRRLDTPQDLKGLKMRIPGLGGKVFSKAGGTSVLVSGGEIYTNLERGVIDATEWLGPYHDYIMGFHEIAKYYYYPGWHEPGTVLELFFNRKKFLELPTDLQEILISGVHRLNLWTFSRFESLNGAYLEKIMAEEKVEVLDFPGEVLETLRKASLEVMAELRESDPFSAKVMDSMNAFKKKQGPWLQVSERAYLDLIK